MLKEVEADEEVELAKDDKGKGKGDDKGKEKVDDKGKGKVDDKGKEKVDDLQNKVNRLKKAKSKLMVSEKGTKKESVDLVDALDLQTESKSVLRILIYVVMFNVVKYPLTDTEIRMFKERPTTSRALIASTSTTSRSIVHIASTSNIQAASTASRGYMKIAMTGCVLSSRAFNDPNAPPPSTT
ncbi:hypothetical protein Tco_1435453 [Tanacetum coccineum]